MLRISGVTPFTMIDFPGALAAVLFCQGCSWRCGYCHNRHLQPFTKGLISWERILHFLEERKGFLDAVVFSGGEPTQQKNIDRAAEEIKAMGYKIGLHTAGVYPDGLKKVLPFLDWVGMDIKAPFAEYEKITGSSFSGEKARRCVSLILKSKVACEFRTTVHPALLTQADLLKLSNEISELGVNKFVIQLFRNQGQKEENIMSDPIFSEAFLNQIAAKFKDFSVR